MSESQTRKQNILYPDSDIPPAIVLYIVLLKQQYTGTETFGTLSFATWEEEYSYRSAFCFQRQE